MSTKDFKAIKFISQDGIANTLVIKNERFDAFMNAAKKMKAFQTEEVEVTEDMLKGDIIYNPKR